MRHLDLFAGIGGFSLAASWMGWETVAQVEWDKWCQKVLAKNFPDTLRFGDIVEFNKMLQDGRINTNTECVGCRERAIEQGEYGIGRSSDKFSDLCETQSINIGRIDILTGGFPCQPFSHAGKRKGTDDSRYLWPEMLTTIRILKPSFVVGENVAGLVSMENGKTLERILSDLENEGYQTESFIIPACGVGAWHRRDRIWIVGYSGRFRMERPLYNTQLPNGIQQESAERCRINGERDNKSNTESIISNSVNDTDRTIGGQSRETESIPCECGETGLSGESCGTGGEILSYPSNSRLQRMQETRNNGSDRKKSINEMSKGCGGGREMRNIESQLGRMVNGLPPLMDGYWDREPEGIPRVATGVKNRVDRLKGLGNAVCPQVPFEIFKAIQNYIDLKE